MAYISSITIICSSAFVTLRFLYIIEKLLTQSQTIGTFPSLPRIKATGQSKEKANISILPTQSGYKVVVKDRKGYTGKVLSKVVD
jgi:hypothetical protein